MLSSLQSRLLVAFGALIAALTAATLAYVSILASGAVDERIAADLAAGRDALVSASEERGSGLALVAQLVASFPELRALFATDTATIRDFLGDYRQRQGRTELLVALDPLGQVIARTDYVRARWRFPTSSRRWLQPARDGRAAHGVLEIDGRAYQAVRGAGGSRRHHLRLRARRRRRSTTTWARALRNASGDEMCAADAARRRRLTLPPDRLPWRSMKRPRRVTEDMSEAVTVGGERFTVIAAPPRTGDAAAYPGAAVARPRPRAVPAHPVRPDRPRPRRRRRSASAAVRCSPAP